MGYRNVRLRGSETFQPIFMKLEIYNQLPDTTLYAKCQRGLHRRGWSGTLGK